MKKDIPKGAVSTKVPPAEVDPIDLPENAFRELAADEEYRPLMHPAREYQEVTPYSVTMGLILAVVFSAAAAYLGLKVGQVFEAAIPIAIIAVGVSSALKKNNALGQNIIIQSIGGSSGVIVAGGHLYPSRSVHIAGKVSRNNRKLSGDIPQFAVRRSAGHSVLHTFPKIFRKGHARQIPLP